MILSFLKELGEYWIYMIPLFFGGLSTFTYMFGRIGYALGISLGLTLVVVLAAVGLLLYGKRHQ